MKTSKKIGLMLATFSASIALAGCVQSGTDKNIITLKGDTITVQDYYKESEKFPNSTATQILQRATLSSIFEREFGKQVTTKDVTAKFNETKESYGSEASFESALSAQGMTDDTYKNQVRLELLQQKAIDKEIKKTQFTEKNLKAAWKDYYPEVDTYVAQDG